MTAKCIDGAFRSAMSSRSCLCCGRAFVSAGAHERVCRVCKDSEEWLAGAAEFPVAPAEARTKGE
jgi:hypothetical protein